MKETLKQLEQAHKKAMEAIDEYNRQLKELNGVIDDILGKGK